MNKQFSILSRSINGTKSQEVRNKNVIICIVVGHSSVVFQVNQVQGSRPLMRGITEDRSERTDGQTDKRRTRWLMMVTRRAAQKIKRLIFIWFESCAIVSVKLMTASLSKICFCFWRRDFIDIIE